MTEVARRDPSSGGYDATAAARHITACPAPGAEWDAFVRAQAGWTHFHLAGWHDVMRRVFRHECVYLEARDAADTLRGVLPLVRVRSLVFGHYLVSLPFVNYGGPLGDEAAVRALGAHAVARATADEVKLLELRARGPLPLELPVSHRKVTVLLDLPPDPAALMKQFEAKLRSQIRRPGKDGITVRMGRDQVGAFFAVFAEHMRDLGTPTQSRRLFEVIADAFPEDAWFAVAYLGETPVACGAGFRYGDEFEITWASALRAHSRSSPNMAIYWALMERCIAEGVRTFNFGRCTPGGGTHRFKLQWTGAREMPLWWYGHSAGGATTPAATPSPTGGAFGVATRLWQRLPLPLATLLGPHVVRGIP